MACEAALHDSEYPTFPLIGEQMAAGEDYLRLYGGCGEAVIAFSHLYAAFDGFSLSAPLQRWWEIDLAGALVNVDSKSVKDQAAKLKTTLRMNTGRFS
eukprot:scaffold204861_cov34-Tisochrysis_lutea.AAC.4